MAIRASLWDINTNTLITNMPFSQANFAVRLSDHGEFTLVTSLTDARVSSPMAALQAYSNQPVKCVFHDQSSIFYAGIVYRYDMVVQNGQPDMSLKLSGSAITSAFALCPITKNYTTAMSPADIVVDVVNSVQAVPGQNLYITPVESLANPPAPITPTYQASQEIMAAQVIADMTASVVPGTGGLDWWLAHQFGYDGGGYSQPLHTMYLNAPRAGADRNTSGWSVDLTKATGFRWSVDNQKLATEAIVIGGGGGAGPNASPRATATAPYLIGGQGQLPLWTQVYSYSQVSSTSQLQNIANGMISVFGQPPVTPVVTLPLDFPSLPFGSVGIGDDVLLQAPNCQWFPTGLSDWFRLVAYRVVLSDSQMYAEYTFNVPPNYS